MLTLGLSKNFICLLSFGVLLLIAGALFNNSLSVFIFYNLICFTLLIIDYFISADESDMNIERTRENNLSIYENEQISFRVHNKSTHKLQLELKDDIPSYHFETKDGIMKGTVPPNEKRDFEYCVVPVKRGAYTFETLNVKCLGRLKLCKKFFKLNLKCEYKVYPNLENVRKYRLNITNNRLFKQGQRNLRSLGNGTAFESLREYTAGDDYRRINWSATAREDKPIVNQYEPEKNQHVHILIDAGRPMSYTIRGYRKLDLAINTALVLADVINQNGDKSGLLLFSSEVEGMIMPGTGPEHRNKLLEALYHIDTTNKTSDYSGAFNYFKSKERHRSIIFLFSDFDTIEEAEDMMKTIPIISKNNIVIVVLIKSESLEAVASEQVKTHEELFTKGVALELIDERRKIIHLLNHRGVLCIECSVENLEYTVINRYIQSKNKSYL